MSRYSLITHWHLDAPIDRVWEAIVAVEDWPRWWRYVHHIEELTKGDANAANQLMPLVYDELRRIAAGHLRRERSGHTLQSTALVHEANLRLIDQRQVEWRNRAHFFALASRMIRRILVDYAR